MEPSSYQQYLKQTFLESLEVKKHFFEENHEKLILAAKAFSSCIQSGGKILILGNGGSAADAQHLAAELVGRMLKDRPALPAIALTTDSSNLTALANDFGYETVFERQIEALCHKEDLVFAISTSGNSQNVLRAVLKAKEKKVFTIGLTGGGGGKLKTLCDLSLCASLGKNSSRIQETHLFAIHAIVDLLDQFFLDQKPPTEEDRL